LNLLSADDAKKKKAVITRRVGAEKEFKEKRKERKVDAGGLGEHRHRGAG